jgi:hypothetical protein
MMSVPEIVKHKNKIIAIIVRKNIKVKGVKFFTPDDYPFQIGFHNRPKNTFLKPHLHPAHNFFIKSSQEVLYILKGKIKVDLYSNDKKFIKYKILNGGDSILFVGGGHAVKFLKKSKIFEIKQGPYPGDKKAKIFI